MYRFFLQKVELLSTQLRNNSSQPEKCVVKSATSLFNSFAALLRSKLQLSLPVLPTFKHKLLLYSNSWIRIFLIDHPVLKYDRKMDFTIANSWCSLYFNLVVTAIYQLLFDYLQYINGRLKAFFSVTKGFVGDD